MKCCNKEMEFKNAIQSLMTGVGELGYDYFFQCKKCGKVKRKYVERDEEERT